ncbi:MAG: hypothetical protein CO094_11915 [Anaerolineae bacterium CG_4_9_14_3_um_filter_57_17]|nr:hypothetical protein [bacterium]NCT20272.1 hypothetical protein [bacterium]OIO84752.1 MAG: hypothetical protein AUK01_08015 [Anaerolineae bacterium CG2_30_57_67]PJB64685.1 MAG: hypothetical protein CO094_11915 [Anaerolineae bacterium CG_4_9_14_3_um_filter_57_17]
MTGNRIAFGILFSAFALVVLAFCGLMILGLFWLNRPVTNPLPTLTLSPRTSNPPTPGLPAASTGFPSLTPTPAGPGKIVYVCQIFKTSANDQICLMNADGSNRRRLTSDDSAKHYYPSFAPDGQSIVFSSNLSGQGQYDLYEMDLLGNIRRLTAGIGILTAPEISPDGQQIAFTRGDGVAATDVWLMKRDGSDPHLLYKNGWDPSWSPDGGRVLFASPVTGYGIQLASVRLDGSDFQRLTNLPNLRGRNDWSADGLWLITYSGQPWQRELFLMNADGANPHQITPAGGNSQGPSFSPDSQFVTFTAYFDRYGDVNGCEIYTLRLDGSQLTRLTDNDYCDWQPRWGP